MKFIIKIFFILILGYAVMFSQKKSFYSKIRYNNHTQIFDFSNYQLLFKLPPFEDFSPKIAYALSGGGARGLAHIGVLKEFEKNGIEPDFIAGTSIGAILGGLYSSGYSANELDSIARNINWNEIIMKLNEQERNDLFIDQKIEKDRSFISLNLKNFRIIVPEGVSLGNKLNSALQELIWNSLYNGSNNFNDLKYEFRAVATDLAQGKTHLFEKGNLALAMKASATFPLRYSPVKIDSLVLVDGGLFANLPSKEVKQFYPDYIIGFNVVSPLTKREDLNSPWALADQLVTALMKPYTDESMKYCDIIMNPKLDNITNQEFNKIDSIIDKGEQFTETQISKIIIELDRIKKNKFFNYINASLIGLDYHERYYLKSSNFTKLDSIELSNYKGSLHDIANKINQLRDKYIYKNIEVYKENDSTILLNAYKFSIIRKIILNSDNNIKEVFAQDSALYSYENLLLNEKNIEGLCELILKKLRKKNYSFAIIKDLEFDESNGLLKLVICEGKVKDIVFLGANNTSDFLIERELKFKKDKPLSSSDIMASWTNLINSGLFDDVNIEIEQAEKYGVKVILNFVESGLQSLKIGARIDNERKFQAGIDFIQENILNVGARLNARLVGGERNWATMLEFQNPQLYNTFWYVKGNAYWNTRDYWLYKFADDNFNLIRDAENTEERFGLSVSMGRQIERLGALNFTLRREWQREFTNSKAKPTFNPITAFKSSFIYDNEDRFDLAKSGLYFELSYESTYLDNFTSNSFSKVEAKYRENFTFHRFTLTPYIYFGFADATLPNIEYFELGGQSVFFGLREEDERNKQITYASFNFRYRSPTKILFDTYLSFRYDIGSTWGELDEMQASKMKHGIGATLSIDSPLGVANFSYGKAYKLYESKFKSTPGLFYFSIGVKM